jgi:hypothetical protein
MVKRIRPAWYLAAGLVVFGVAQADVWRWVDASGRVHYSDVPVDGAVRIKSTVTRADAGGGGSTPSSVVPNAPLPQPTLESRSVAITAKLEDEAAARAVQGDLARKRAEQCKTATQRYDQAIASRRLYREGEGGARVYLTDAELDKARVDARRERDLACNPGATPR